MGFNIPFQGLKKGSRRSSETTKFKTECCGSHPNPTKSKNKKCLYFVGELLITLVITFLCFIFCSVRMEPQPLVLFWLSECHMQTLLFRQKKTLLVDEAKAQKLKLKCMHFNSICAQFTLKSSKQLISTQMCQYLGNW